MQHEKENNTVYCYKKITSQRHFAFRNLTCNILPAAYSSMHYKPQEQ
jgi:hypothetical protein